MGGLRQFESTAETDRIRPMKAKSSSKSLNRNPKFAAGVERALLRAEEAARRLATLSGGPSDQPRLLLWLCVGSVPAGFTPNSLPVGLQIVGRYRDDFGVLQMAHAFEQATGVGRRRPPIATA